MRRRRHDGVAVDLVLLLLVERPPLRQEQHLGAEQADALGAVLVQQREFLPELDVGLERDRMPVLGLGRHLEECLAVGRDARELGRLQLRRHQRLRLRVDDHRPREAVHDHHVVRADVLGEAVQAHDRGHAERAGHDRDVARRAAEVEHDAQDAPAAEQQHVGRGQVLRDHDAVRVDLRHRAPLLEVSEDAVLHVLEVGRALAERRVRARLQPSPVLVQHRLHRPPRPGGVVADVLDDRVVELTVPQDQPLRVEDARRALAQLLARDDRDLAQFALAPLDGALESLQFRLDVRRVEMVGRGLVGACGEQVRGPDGDAGGHADALDPEFGTGLDVRDRRIVEQTTGEVA